MAVAEPHEHRRARRRGLVAALERFAGLDQREAARGRNAERFEHLGRQHFANAALERQPPVAEAAVRRLPRSLGAEVHQPAVAVAHLREQESAPVADIGIVHAELVPVIAQRERLLERAGEGREAPEMRDPFRRRSACRARPPPPRGRCGSAGSFAGNPPPRRDRRTRRPVPGSWFRGDKLAGERACGNMAVSPKRTQPCRLMKIVTGSRTTRCGCTIATIRGAQDRPPILCLAGLTRNARDFEELAERLAGRVASHRGQFPRARRERGMPRTR